MNILKKNKKLNEEELFITQNLERAINVIKGIEKIDVEEIDTISIPDFCKKYKGLIPGQKNTYSWLRGNDFIKYNKYKNNIPTDKAKDMKLITEKTEIVTDTLTGKTYKRISPQLTKSGELFFKELLIKEQKKR